MKHTHINISSVDIYFTYKEEPIHINLINKEKIDCDKYKGYKNVHLSVVKLGLGSLVGPFILVSSLCVVFYNTYHIDFVDVVIDSFLGPLDNGL